MKTRNFILIFAAFLIFSNIAAAQAKKIRSVYTDLASEKCRQIELDENEGVLYRGECAGVGGYKLEVIEGDLRQTINVIAPNGEKRQLDFQTNVSYAFSFLGEKAEWRVSGEGKKAKPLALIVRFNVSENPEKLEKNTSFLIVSKITDKIACITDIVKPSKNANAMARKLADASADKPCKAAE